MRPRALAPALAMIGIAMNLEAAEALRIITVNPGHFHAALVQQKRLPGIAEEAVVLAPLGPDLAAHLGRVARFNTRAADPTSWRLRVYAGPDYLHRLREEPKGSIVVLSGANRGKMERVRAALDTGMHGLIDKPWILQAAEMPALEAALATAAERRLVIFDGMTERFEISRLLQRYLVNEAAVFGKPAAGSAAEPAVEMGSIHYLYKLVAGAPNLRPPSFFDVDQQGEGITDVGPHYVDLAHWSLFPDQALDHAKDIQIHAAKRWATPVSLEEFRKVTGEAAFPEYLKPALGPNGLEYFCNDEVTYSVRGVPVRIRVEWKYAAPEGAGDYVSAVFRGTRSAVQLEAGAEQKFRPEVYVVPNAGADRAAIAGSLKEALARAPWPGLELRDEGARLHVVIPDKYRIGHEAHFSVLLDTFLGYVRNPQTQPAWERPNMLAKYYVTTGAAALARRNTQGKASQ